MDNGFIRSVPDQSPLVGRPNRFQGLRPDGQAGIKHDVARDEITYVGNQAPPPELKAGRVFHMTRPEAHAIMQVMLGVGDHLTSHLPATLAGGVPAALAVKELAYQTRRPIHELDLKDNTMAPYPLAKGILDAADQGEWVVLHNYNEASPEHWDAINAAKQLAAERLGKLGENDPDRTNFRLIQIDKPE